MPTEFSVRPRDQQGPVRRMVESSPEAAAAAYLETWHSEGDEAMSVVVRDIETGHEHCFRLEDDEAVEGPCV